MTETRDVVVIEGDGVGPEIVGAAVRVLQEAGASLNLIPAYAGEEGLRRYGDVAPDETLRVLQQVGAALKGPFHTPSGGTRRSPNYRIRLELELFANIRPLPIGGLPQPIILVRENVEDVYSAIEWSPAPGITQAVKVATERGCQRIARAAFGLAERDGRSRVTVVHKANNLKLTEGLFLDVANAVAQDFPDIACDDLLVDTAASELVLDPARYDVILTSNTFGDILSNVGAAVAGSLGLVASLNRGDTVAIGEASHGSADQLAGSGRVNPVAMIRAGALLAREMGMPEIANRIESAVDTVLKTSTKTLDLGGQASTTELTDAIIAALDQSPVHAAA